MMNPYTTLRAKLQRPLFVPFAVLGYPNEKTSLEVIEALIKGGADALELGIPFSDPPADGPIIQAADTAAIAAGITPKICFSLIKKIRETCLPVGRNIPFPIGILTYFNIVFVRGIDRFYADCKASGVDSVLVADLPLEHLEEVAAAAKKNGIAVVSIISEVTTDERLREIKKYAGGYLYAVSYLGVTGAEKNAGSSQLSDLIKRSKKIVDLPVIVGFGISTPEHVRRTAESGADGVIVGSRLVAGVQKRENLQTLCSDLKAPLLEEAR